MIDGVLGPHIAIDYAPEDTDCVGWIGDCLDSLLELFGSSPEWEGHTGGCCVMAETATGAPLWLRIIGTLDRVRYVYFCTQAQEQAVRLAACAEHVSSWQSRETRHHRCGGAIRTPKWLFSFAGLPELGNEALMLVAAVKMGYLEFEAAQAIATISANLYFQPLADKFLKDGDPEE